MNKKEFYESLSDEVKAKIKACKTEEEMLKVLQDEKIELDPELLESVSGGNSNFGSDSNCNEVCNQYCGCD
jgi:hypothetical protein